MFTYTINGATIPIFPGAWMNTGGATLPIFSSVADYRDYFMNDTDDGYLVMPGFKITVYKDFYSNTTNTYDNTSGTTIKYFACLNVNNGTSCKLYYNNTEVPEVMSSDAVN